MMNQELMKMAVDRQQNPLAVKTEGAAGKVLTAQNVINEYRDLTVVGAIQEDEFMERLVVTLIGLTGATTELLNELVPDKNATKTSIR